MLLVEVDLGATPLTPNNLSGLVKDVDIRLPAGWQKKIVIVSGRMPVWAFGALIHFLHPSRAVATFDPRLGGGVVVESHVPEFRLGDIVNVDAAEVVVVKVEL